MILVIMKIHMGNLYDVLDICNWLNIYFKLTIKRFLNEESWFSDSCFILPAIMLHWRRLTEKHETNAIKFNSIQSISFMFFRQTASV